MSDYKQRRKWHIKLTKILCILAEMAEELPITRGEVEILCYRISTLQTNLVRAKKESGKITNREKREKVISLAVANPTLSMSAIARHYGFSEPFVSRVFEKYGSEINTKQKE